MHRVTGSVTRRSKSGFGRTDSLEHQAEIRTMDLREMLGNKRPYDNRGQDKHPTREEQTLPSRKRTCRLGRFKLPILEDRDSRGYRLLDNYPVDIQQKC